MHSLDSLSELVPEADSSSAQVEFTSISTGILVFLVVIWSLFGHKIAARSRYLGEGSVACLLGLVTGLLLLLYSLIDDNPGLDRLLSFNSAAFFTYLLPPVIFYAGISVERKRFFSQLPSIFSYGVLGTVVCFLIFTIFLLLLTTLRVEDVLALSAIFAATDSVATLQTLDQQTHPLLFSLVFGEGVMNDATSVVLLNAVTNMCRKECPSLTVGVATGIMLNFLYLFTTSFLLGAAVGLGISFALRRGGLQGPHQEVALIGLLSYLGYLVAEFLGLSGILSLFCCGVVVSHFALRSASEEGATSTMNAFRALSYMAEGLIFIYVGMDALDPKKWTEANTAEVFWLGLLLVVVLLLSRAAFVVPISLAHNFWSREKLSSRDIVIIWWSGLIRGAVSVALVYYQFDSGGFDNLAHKATLIVSTVTVVLVSIFLFGALTKPLLSLMMSEGDGEESVMQVLVTIGDRAQPRARLRQWISHFRGYHRVGSSNGLRAELHELDSPRPSSLAAKLGLSHLARSTWPGKVRSTRLHSETSTPTTSDALHAHDQSLGDEDEEHRGQTSLWVASTTPTPRVAAREEKRELRSPRTDDDSSAC